MTKEELQKILRLLGLDYAAEAKLVYVFYELPDGRIGNFSLGIRRGRTMSDDEVVGMMRREYPATRQGTVLTIERPSEAPRSEEWLDTADVCAMLKVTPRTLRNWSHAGRLKPHRVGNRVYYSHREIDELIKLMC